MEVDFYQILREKMVPICELTLTSVRQKMNKNNRRFCFEIFGYDFMIDEGLNPWLIEVNTNPCLEESNQLLRYLLALLVAPMLKINLPIELEDRTTWKFSQIYHLFTLICQMLNNLFHS